jgi:hypothetical protein
MAEIIQRAGTWTFDGRTVRIVPGAERQVPALRKTLGEVAVPLAAIAGIAFEPGRKGGRLRLRLRDGADPLSQVAGGRLPDASDPYQLPVEKDRMGVAEYVVDEVRNFLLLEGIPDTPCDRYLLSGPSVPLTANGTDGTASFDGERLHLEWNWMAEESKTHSGPRTFTLQELDGIEWTPAMGWENGSLRIRPKGRQPALRPQHDPNCLLLWGVRQARETGGSVLLAAAVTARLPHPHASATAAPSGHLPAQPAGPALAAGLGTGFRPDTFGRGGRDGGDGGEQDKPAESDHDVLLRRLRELGELHKSGVLTDEEFALAKRSVLIQF